MAKKYTFKVTATLRLEDEDLTREDALVHVETWLKGYEYSELPDLTPFYKIEIV